MSVDNPGMETGSEASQIRTMLYGQLVSKALCAVARYGIPDALAEQPRTADELADDMGLHPGATRRLLRALAANGIFHETETGVFTPTRLGRMLCEGVPGSARPTALLLANEVGATWAELARTVETGQSAFHHVHGTDLFTYLERNPGPRATFDASQKAGLGLELDEIIDFVDFSGYQSIVDVGGGDATLLCRLLNAYPETDGTVLELPGTAVLASERIEAEGLDQRCRSVSGSFFEGVPEGADLYLLCHVLHDWDDESAVRILRTCRKSMAARSKLLVIDLAADARDDGGVVNRTPALMDLYMLTLFGASGGRERTEAEFSTLLDRAGYLVAETKILPSGMAVVTAEPRSA